MEVKKTYFAVEDTDDFKAGHTVFMKREDANRYLIRRSLVPFQSAVRLGLVDKFKKVGTAQVSDKNKQTSKTRTPTKSKRRRLIGR